MDSAAAARTVVGPPSGLTPGLIYLGISRGARPVAGSKASGSRAVKKVRPTEGFPPRASKGIAFAMNAGWLRARTVNWCAVNAGGNRKPQAIGRFGRAVTTATLLASAPPAAAFASAACEWGSCTPVLKTSMLDLRRDGAQTRDLLKLTRVGGYELAGGGYQSFSRWYAGQVTPIRADLITQLTPGIGLLWGVTTGDSGEKYKLQPGFRAGLVGVASLSHKTSLSFTARTTFGGRLLEKPCTANYGEIGGVQVVNCRLAASDLAPQDTLAYLWDFAPADQNQLTVRLTVRF